MQRELRFTTTAELQLGALSSKPAVLKQVHKTLGYMETDLRHPGLHTHEFTSLQGANREKVFEAYAQNRTPGAYRIFWHYGPDEKVGRKRVPILTIIAIEPHPDD